MANPLSLPTDFAQLLALANSYFEGLYEANTTKLANIFHPSASLSAPGLRLDRAGWLAKVKNRSIPMLRGDAFNFSVRSIDVVGEQAIISVHCPLLGHNYFDFLSCLKEDQRWSIVHKLYAETNHPPPTTRPTV